MKSILPTLREKNRYVAFEVLSDSPISRGDVVKASWGGVLRFLGELGAAKTSLWVMDWDDASKTGVLKVSHSSLDDVRAALALVKEVNGSRAAFRVLGVSGTVKKARAKFLGK